MIVRFIFGCNPHIECFSNAVEDVGWISIWEVVGEVAHAVVVIDPEPILLSISKAGTITVLGLVIDSGLVLNNSELLQPAIKQLLKLDWGQRFKIC